MSVTLSINGYPVCGVVGGKMTMATGDCWESYHKWVTSLADGPLCVLRDVPWAVNGKMINEPRAWFVTLIDHVTSKQS